MPRSKRVTGLGNDRTITVGSRYFYRDNTASTMLTFNLNPLSLGPMLLNISDDYMEYRFKKVKMSVASTSTEMANAAFTPVVLSAAPTAQTLWYLPIFAQGTGHFGSPFPSITVTKELYINAPRWFRRGTAYDDLLETQGFFYAGWADGTAFNVRTINVLIEFTVELRGIVDTALSVARTQPWAKVPSEKKEDPSSDDGVLVEPDPAHLQEQINLLASMLGASLGQPDPSNAKVPAGKQSKP